MPINGLPSGPVTLPVIVAPNVGDAQKKAKPRKTTSLCTKRMMVTSSAFSWSLRFELPMPAVAPMCSNGRADISNLGPLRVDPNQVDPQNDRIMGGEQPLFISPRADRIISNDLPVAIGTESDEIGAKSSGIPNVSIVRVKRVQHL